MNWNYTTTGNTVWYQSVPEFVDFRDDRTATEVTISQSFSMIAENLKIFVRELTEEIKNGTLVFNEQDIERRIDELFLK